MQPRIFLLLGAFLWLWLPQAVRAESSHFAPADLKTETVFSSVAGDFKLKMPAADYQEPLDVYLFKLPKENLSGKLVAVSDIYSYYLYSPEIAVDIELTITITYQGDNPYEKTVYYYDQKAKDWRLADQRAFKNNLTFKLKGKENQLVIAGKSLSGQIAPVAATVKEKASFIYQFNALDALSSELKAAQVCPDYLSTELRPNSRETAAVQKLQTFLNEETGADLPISGYFGPLTERAVTGFQEKYRSSILSPWGLSSGTGRVLKTTLKEINRLDCARHPEQIIYQAVIPYELAGSRAKAAYYLSEATSAEEWVKAESFDDVKAKKVTALLKQPIAKLALFEEEGSVVGEASWYAWKNGSFAASRDFPVGSKLKVTNQGAGKNQGKAVVVTVNDYGPEIRTKRIIDLDKAAFAQIADLKDGVISVKIERQ